MMMMIVYFVMRFWSCLFASVL